MKKPFDLHADYQPESFEFTKANQKKIEEIIALYPKGRQQSGVMPLLDLAQRQVGEEGAKANPPYGGWIPRAAMDKNRRNSRHGTGESLRGLQFLFDVQHGTGRPEPCADLHDDAVLAVRLG
jgi:hypothetical protein